MTVATIREAVSEARAFPGKCVEIPCCDVCEQKAAFSAAQSMLERREMQKTDFELFLIEMRNGSSLSFGVTN